MSPESFEQFRTLVFADAALQAQLRAVADEERFIALVVRLGAERGYEFTADDVRAAMRAARRAWIERWLP